MARPGAPACHLNTRLTRYQGGTRWTDIFKKEGGIPALIDVISLDDYYLSVAEHRSFYETAVCVLPCMHACNYICW